MMKHTVAPTRHALAALCNASTLQAPASEAAPVRPRQPAQPSISRRRRSSRSDRAQVASTLSRAASAGEREQETTIPQQLA